MSQSGRRIENRVCIPELFEKGATKNAVNTDRNQSKVSGSLASQSKKFGFKINQLFRHSRLSSFPLLLPNKKSSQGGFTLLEVAIAMGIFGITLVSSIAAVSQMHLLQETGRNLSVASFHAQKVIEQIRLLADTSIESASAVNWTTWAGANGCDTLANEAVSVSFAGVTSNLTEVIVNIAWNTKDHPMTYQVVTRVVN